MFVFLVMDDCHSASVYKWNINGYVLTRPATVGCTVGDLGSFLGQIGHIRREQIALIGKALHR